MKQIALLAALLLASWEVSACKCLREPLATTFEKAPIAFVGSLRSGQKLSGTAADTVTFDVVRALKGNVRAGVPIELNPMFGTSCAAYLVPNATVLVFAYEGMAKEPAISACSMRGAAPLSVDGKELRPDRDVLEFLASLSAD